MGRLLDGEGWERRVLDEQPPVKAGLLLSDAKVWQRTEEALKSE